MHLMYFTEQPMSAYPPDEGDRYGYTALLFPNKFFDPDRRAAGSTTSGWRNTSCVEEVGYDGIMLNEHHNAPFCMQAKINIFAAILAAITKRVKIVLLGNPLPVADNPVRLAEELAMIDMISKGRLVSGFVRGGGVESLPGQHQSGLQPRALRRSPRPDHQDLDHAGTVALGRQSLPVPGGQSVGAADAAAASANLDSGGFQPRDHRVVRRSIAIPTSR